MTELKENIVKEIKVFRQLGKMIESDTTLYEQILETEGFAFYFNELVKLAIDKTTETQ